MCEEINKD